MKHRVQWVNICSGLQWVCPDTSPGEGSFKLSFAIPWICCNCGSCAVLKWKTPEISLAAMVSPCQIQPGLIFSTPALAFLVDTFPSALFTSS